MSFPSNVRLALALILVALGAGAATDPVRPAPDVPEPSPFAARIVMLGGPPDRDDVRRHVRFALASGFNAIWLRGEIAGRWAGPDAADRPKLDPLFLQFAAECRRKNVRLFVEISPVRESDGTFRFTHEPDAERLISFVRRLRRKAGVRDVVLSFQGSPLRLTELSDLLEYGRFSAAAHVALTARVRREISDRVRVWFAPSIFADTHLDDPQIRYSEVLLESIAGLDRNVGIVWTGSRPISPEIRAVDLAATRKRLGGRELLLQDRYPGDLSGDRLALALALGPLRGREPGIAAEIAGYVACPMRELGGSRLALATVADFLANPEAYDPESSWTVEQNRLAGADAAVLEALDAQTMEWGGWVDRRNYRAARLDNPVAVAVSLRDPAATAAWKWTRLRYPERIRALAGLRDESFRDDLLDVMERRLAIARAVPIVVKLRERPAGGSAETNRLAADLLAERTRVADRPSALAALDRFLIAAGVATGFSGDPGKTGTGNPDQPDQPD